MSIVHPSALIAPYIPHHWRQRDVHCSSLTPHCFLHPSQLEIEDVLCSPLNSSYTPHNWRLRMSFAHPSLLPTPLTSGDRGCPLLTPHCFPHPSQLETEDVLCSPLIASYIPHNCRQDVHCSPLVPHCFLHPSQLETEDVHCSPLTPHCFLHPLPLKIEDALCSPLIINTPWIPHY